MVKMKLRSLSLVILASLILVPAVTAAPLADVTVGNASLELSPIVSVHAMKLVVTGPDGFHYEETFNSSQPIFLPFKADMADGLYKYELASLAPARSRKAAGNGFDRIVRTYTQSGAFTIRGGAGVDSSLLENPPTKDIVQLDDVIIQFSLCVGNDCANGENFGFDTLRLKENNVRVHFDDTSTTASFPQNDWRIIINDSSNGGANFFGVEDSTAGRIPFRIEAGAPSNTLYAEADGDVGIKTANPAVDLHVVEGNTPTLRLEQDGSDGFTAQTFDVAANEANFFVRDVTNGSKLSFRIRPGAPESSIDIAASGNVGLNNSSPNAPLHVRSSGSSFVSTNPANTVAIFQNNVAASNSAILSVIAGSAGNAQITLGDSVNATAGRIQYSNSSGFMRFDVGGNQSLRIDQDREVCMGECNMDATSDLEIRSGVMFSTINAGSTTFMASSSRTIKENLEAVDADDILSKISDVDVFTYDFIDGPKDRLGLMAEDFHTIFGRGTDKMIAGQEVQMALWLAVQELTAQNKELAARVAELEGAAEE